MSDVRTPLDEVDTPGYFYAPFNPGWTYEGQTYGGHTDFAVDWNRRRVTPGGVEWVQDDGDPVHASADGTVNSVDPSDGTVVLSHWRGQYRTEYVHMDPILVKPGQKVQRGHVIGRIGAKGTESAHLHVVHWKRSGGEWKRIKQSWEGVEVGCSVWNSDSMPKSWNPPPKVYVQGPPPKATWRSAYRDMAAERDKAAAQVERLQLQNRTVSEELGAALVKLAECQNAAPPPLDCSVAVAQERAHIRAAVMQALEGTT